MQPDSQTGLNSNETAQTNGHVKHEETVNGKEALVGAVLADKQGHTGDRNTKEEKIVLPNEMASMVPLQLLVGKVIRKAHADLMTLTDTYVLDIHSSLSSFLIIVFPKATIAQRSR